MELRLTHRLINLALHYCKKQKQTMLDQLQLLYIHYVFVSL